MRSDKIKKGVERIGARALLYATGISKEDMAKPFIAGASSRTDIIPGHIHMARLERFIERGPQRIKRVENARMYMVVEDLYYAMLESAQAVLMFLGRTPPRPGVTGSRSSC